MKCPKCGMKNADGAMFCDACGAFLKKAPVISNDERIDEPAINQYVSGLNGRHYLSEPTVYDGIKWFSCTPIYGL